MTSLLKRVSQFTQFLGNLLSMVMENRTGSTTDQDFEVGLCIRDIGIAAGLQHLDILIVGFADDLHKIIKAHLLNLDARV